MFTLRQLEFAVAVAEEGGFTAAARRCNTVQSALSHQVAKIEEALGARLFERGPRQVRPTAAGEVFLHNARQTLRAAERLHDEMAQALGTVRGRLTLGQISSLTTVRVPALLRQFRTAHARVDVHLRTAMSEALLHDLSEGRLDVALVGVGPQVALPAQRLLLHEESLALIVPAAHRFATRKRVALAELDDEPMAGLVAGAGVRGIVDGAFDQAGLRQRQQYEVTHADLMRELVAAGLAVAIVPQTMAGRMRTVVTVALKERFVFQTYAVWRPDPTPAARAFVALLGGAAPA
ncbi:LysR family transcriptional regulator [Xanthomonas melonis]|uniref:LysR family transcriptional regulator n=1 Tax=Xanthomonas melonis TaxID=56456 RepID=A0A2S7DJF8_9XANT|nr:MULTISPECIES: LysR family transcriptional regulator [Xanthomonas]MCC4588362.1 LysR family transcriptional regulator [Xanthomonas sp. NCPPB 1067]MCC4599236.1 LysR family transcriptional regulator [Xanthomonas melonis]MCD0245672.1 LysR family transcriptional regulator [Xanthomonas melonis]MCD0258333.1 LysR family transcriptional regulator [Xanthomonas melonis]MCD0266534.1 LysR family transcriptional regulator [Xanthomonas melonis]